MLLATALSSVEGSLVARNPRQISNAAQINPATASKTSAINGVFHFPISDSLAVLLGRETDIVSERLLTSCQFWAHAKDWAANCTSVFGSRRPSEQHLDSAARPRLPSIAREDSSVSGAHGRWNRHSGLLPTIRSPEYSSVASHVTRRGTEHWVWVNQLYSGAAKLPQR
jgi:hypothetical protein